MTEGISLLEEWYVGRCNGDWEHQSGVKIGTLDNPGWTLDIDLNQTKTKNRQLEHTRIERTENDWINYWVEKKEFKARMGPTNLSEAIKIFCQWFDESG
jgi:hypothetical protein